MPELLVLRGRWGRKGNINNSWIHFSSTPLCTLQLPFPHPLLISSLSDTEGSTSLRPAQDRFPSDTVPAHQLNTGTQKARHVPPGCPHWLLLSRGKGFYILRDIETHYPGQAGIPPAPHFPQIPQFSFYSQGCPSSRIIFILLSTNSLPTWVWSFLFLFSHQRPFQHHKSPLTASKVH